MFADIRLRLSIGFRSLGRWPVLLAVALVALPVLPGRATSRKHPTTSGVVTRYVVSEIRAEGDLQKAATRAHAALKRELRKHRGIEVLSDAASEDGAPGADRFVSGSLVREGEDYVLALSVVGARDPTPVKTSERMHLLRNIPMNVKLCLERLLQSQAATPPDLPLAAPPPAVKEASDPLPATPPVPAPRHAHGADAGRPVLAVLDVKAGPGFHDGEVAALNGVLLSALDTAKRFRIVEHATGSTLIDVLAGATTLDYLVETELGRLDLEQADHGNVLTLRLIDVRHSTVLLHTRRIVQTIAELPGAIDELARQALSAAPEALPQGSSEPTL